MASEVEQREQPQVACTSCGRRFRYPPEKAGRTVRCTCGAAILIPMPHDSGDDSDEYDLAPEPEAKRAPVAAAVAKMSPAVGLAAAPGAADAPLPTAVSAAPVTVHIPPQRKGLSPQERTPEGELAPKASDVRDFVVPSLLIAIGVGLRFVEVMSPAATKTPLDFGPALGTVWIKLCLSVGLLLGAMFLTVQMLEVCFVGPLHRTAYKLVGIAVGPGALYGILSYAGGEMYGSMIGTFSSLAAYGLLFWLLMRLDLKDTGWCVLITWIVVTAANYAAYRAEGLIRDSWV